VTASITTVGLSKFGTTDGCEDEEQHDHSGDEMA